MASRPRSYGALAALVLAVALSSAGRALPAQAAPAGVTPIRFFMVAYKVGGSSAICVGESVLIKAIVYRSGPADAGDPVAGVTVNGWAHNPNVGQVSPRQTQTAMANSFPGSAEFTFLAHDAGTTTVTLEGRVDEHWFGIRTGASGPISASVEVRVIPCNFKVDTHGQWLVPGPANIRLVAMIEGAELKADDQGHLTGSATVNWVGTAGGVGDCPPGMISITPSQADMTGELDDTGRVAADVTFQPAAGSVFVTCGESGAVPIQLGPDPLHISMPAEGGVSQLAQVVQGPEGPMPGSVIVVVIPEEAQAAAARLSPRAAWLAQIMAGFSISTRADHD